MTTNTTETPAATAYRPLRAPAATSRAHRGWAYLGLALGGAVSIAANVAHSYVPPPDAPTVWHPHGGAVAAAVVWPVFLFVAVEILAKHQWPHGRRWAALRYLGLLPLAVVAAVVSYRHLSGLLAFYGEDALTSAVGPLAVDGLMVMATGALVAAGRDRQPTTVEVPAAVPVPAPQPGPEAQPGPATQPVPGAPAGDVAGSGRPSRRARRTGTRTAVVPKRRTDADLIAVLADVPRNPDGTVPVRRAAAVLGTGPDRARRLLADTGLLHPTTPEPDPNASDVPAPAVTPVPVGLAPATV